MEMPAPTETARKRAASWVADGSPPENRHAGLRAVEVDEKIGERIGKIPGPLDRGPVHAAFDHGFKGNQEHLAHPEVEKGDPDALLSERLRNLTVEAVKGGVLERVKHFIHNFHELAEVRANIGEERSFIDVRNHISSYGIRISLKLDHFPHEIAIMPFQGIFEDPAGLAKKLNVPFDVFSDLALFLAVGEDLFKNHDFPSLLSRAQRP